MHEPSRPTTFVSYARADDEPFVRRLVRDLETHGFVVWFDRDDMPSDGKSFAQELRDSIERANRVVAIIGPKALNSEYCRVEWEHALLFAKSITPVLRLSDFSDLPAMLRLDDGHGLADDGLGLLHAIDMRDDTAYPTALKDLCTTLSRPVPPLGRLALIPPLPERYVPRRERIEQLSKVILADLRTPETIAHDRQMMSLTGMVGIGKSVLAAAFARSIATRRAFGDGIVWLQSGRDTSASSLLDHARLQALPASARGPCGERGWPRRRRSHL